MIQRRGAPIVQMRLNCECDMGCAGTTALTDQVRTNILADLLGGWTIRSRSTFALA